MKTGGDDFLRTLMAAAEAEAAIPDDAHPGVMMAGLLKAQLERLTAERDAEHKRWTTLQARCALVGLAVTRSQDDAGRTVYIASKWALTRQCASLDEVEQLLRSIGGPAA